MFAGKLSSLCFILTCFATWFRADWIALVNLVTSLSRLVFEAILEWLFIVMLASNSFLKRFQSAFFNNQVVGPGSGSVVVGQLNKTGLWSEDSSHTAVGSCKFVIFLFIIKSMYVCALL